MTETPVETTGGAIRGLRIRGLTVFRGIPYGDSTAGANRFRAPVPVTPRAGVRDAYEFGPRAPQCDGRAAGRMGELVALLLPDGTDGGPTPEMSEDCLRLDVWTPDVAGAGMPVMLWLHGGGFHAGWGSQLYGHADVLAEREEVVVVTVNHRLGVLGYTAIAEAAGDEFLGSGLAGMLDIVLALTWVHDNIRSFGGDPGNVTIFGQSGGGMKVSALMAMPRAAGLFHRAIIQSGPAFRVADRERGGHEAAMLLDAFGLTAATADRLRSVPLEAILDFQRRSMAGGGAAGESPLRYLPVADGDDLPHFQLSASPTWGRSRVRVLIGTTTDEWGWFLSGEPEFDVAMDEGSVRTRLKHVLGEKTEEVLARYRTAIPAGRPYIWLRRVLSDIVMRAPSVRLAEMLGAGGAPTYMYLFAHEPLALNGLAGSFHGADLPYVFGTTNRVPLTRSDPHAETISRVTGALWASFARDGVPLLASQEVPDYEHVRRATARICVEPAVVERPGGQSLASLEGVTSPLFE